MKPTKRIAVIGAGCSGLGSIVELKSKGFEPVCFEISDKYGGTWQYKKISRYGQASTMPTTIINNSKELGAVSHFPPKKEFSNYMRLNEIYEYITAYAKEFDCERYIRYKTEVVRVERVEDYEISGRWYVTSKNLDTGETKREMFDGVFVATGHYNVPNIPEYPGQDRFKGKILHTHSLKEVEEFQGQNVVVVGVGCSGLDAAVETSRVANQVYLSSRSGAFILNRVGPSGYPIDYVLNRRYLLALVSILPANLCSWYVETFYVDKLFHQTLYNIKPKYHLLSKDPILNDEIATKLFMGSVKQKGDIKYFTENGVCFDGDEEVTSVDTVIMATGYTWDFQFLEDGIFVFENGIINLYKCMYPPHLPHPTLVFIGFLSPFGPGIPLGELQIRWAAYILANNGKLPSNDIMMNDIMKRHISNQKRFSPSDFMSVRVDCIAYMDEIANEFGVKPNLLKYIFTDFQLFLKLVFGPAVPYQYRLQGDGKWEGAREAIMTAHDRLHYPLIADRTLKKGIKEYVAEYVTGLIITILHIFI